jgi:ABC-type phosphonate transport system ATPase subunit
MASREADKRGMIDDADSIRRAEAIFDMLRVEVDPTALVGDLGAGQKQLTELAKAISQDARVLILDEPSTALSVSDVERLTREVRGNEVIFSEKGFPLPNPLTVQLEQARKMVVKLSAEFGATPLARARFASKDSAPKDAFEDWEREQAGG